MQTNKPLPTAFVVVAVLFILSGVGSAWEILVSLTQGQINLNFGVLGIPVGFGLFCLSPGWRTCALVLLWLGLLGTPLMVIVMIMAAGGPGANIGSNPQDIEKGFMLFSSIKVTANAVPVILIMGTVAFCLCLWMYRVLTRPDIRALFGLARAPVESHSSDLGNDEWQPRQPQQAKPRDSNVDDSFVILDPPRDEKDHI